jgi:hypothetical protein
MSEATEVFLSFSMETPDSYLKGLEPCFFPNLRVLRIELNITPSVLIFIYRNSRGIRDLHVLPHGYTNLFSAPLCTFPELEFYSGACRLIPAVLPGSPVQRISTDFYAADIRGDITAEMEHSLSVLHQTTGPLMTFSVFSDHWNLVFFEILSRHAPNILQVEYGNVEDNVVEDDVDVISVRQFYILLCFDWRTCRS